MYALHLCRIEEEKTVIHIYIYVFTIVKGSNDS